MLSFYNKNPDFNLRLITCNHFVIKDVYDGKGKPPRKFVDQGTNY